MRTNILPGYIRNKLPVSVLFAVQYESSFFALIPQSKPPATEEQAEFQRHVKAREIRGGVERDGGEVIDSEPALLDHPFDPGEAKISRVVLL